MDAPLTENAALLLSALVAAAVACVVAALVVWRRAPADTVSPTSRVRFPARAIERGAFVGAFAVCAAAVSASDVDTDVATGVAAVVAGAGWMLWRGTAMSLLTSSRAPDGRRG